MAAPGPAPPLSQGTNCGILLHNRKNEEKTPTHVDPTPDSDMLTSLLYPVSNLNTERVLAEVGAGL